MKIVFSVVHYFARAEKNDVDKIFSIAETFACIELYEIFYLVRKEIYKKFFDEPVVEMKKFISL